MMCRFSPPLPFPPPPSGGLLPLLIPLSYHRSIGCPAHGHTGVFHNNFLWYKLFLSFFLFILQPKPRSDKRVIFITFLGRDFFYAINPFLLFLPALLFSAHFTQYLFAEKMHPFFCRTIIWEILLPIFPLLRFYFLITHANYLFWRNKTTL